MTIPPVEVERLRQHVEAVDQWRRLKAEHELEIKASYGDPPFRPRRRAVESDLVYTRRLARMQDRICLRWDRLRRLWQDDHPAPEPDVTPTDVLDDVVSNRSIVRNLFPYTERVLQGGSAARRDQEMKDAAVWWGKKHRECLAKVRQLTQIVPSITDHPLLDESKASTPLVGIDRIEQWCRGAVAAMATPDGEVAKLRKLGDILDGWATAYIRAPRAELAKLPMLFGNDKIVTVIQREAGEPMREQLEELNELRLTLDNATDDELAEIVTVDPPRWAKASPPMTRTRENDLRQKVAGIASHLSDDRAPRARRDGGEDAGGIRAGEQTAS